MSTDPNYPTGALEALTADILARGPCDLLVDRKGAHALLDALAAMSPEGIEVFVDWLRAKGGATTTSHGAALIAAERARQVAVEGWMPDHDDGHTDGSLAQAAVCYAIPPLGSGWSDAAPPARWPFEPEAWKPRGQIDNLVRAGALIAAEIDRLHRRSIARCGGPDAVK